MRKWTNVLTFSKYALHKSLAFTCLYVNVYVWAFLLVIAGKVKVDRANPDPVGSAHCPFE